ncbi:MAG: DUF438 domain-containing protein [Candidatus Zixiibacteriota bacterium]
MRELIDSAQKRKDILKHMILQLHKGEAPDAIKKQLIRLLGDIPYGEVVEVEQELITEGLPIQEVLKLCDIHTVALKGHIDQSGAAAIPPGHPVHTFKQENRALEWALSSAKKIFDQIDALPDSEDATGLVLELRSHMNALIDVEKHYARKENLLFPYLEKHEITGPPTVMWGKHDETRALLKAAIEAVNAAGEISAVDARTVAELVLKPAANAIEEMIYKEEQILLPMCVDTLNDTEWYAIYQQSSEIGFCLYDPEDSWRPEGMPNDTKPASEQEQIQLPSGSVTVPELTAMLNTIPFDLTFVDKDDTVRFFTQGRERIFARNRAILGRKVQLCHPPGSVHIVQKIVDDFRSGKASSAPFWITLGGRFIHIEYYALHDENGNYLGTLEVSQDLTEKKKLEGEQRLLSYSKE